MYYFNARWYDPQIGRFINEDPIKSDANWYAYCNNNPINFIDPTGLMSESQHAGAMGRAKHYGGENAAKAFTKSYGSSANAGNEGGNRRGNRNKEQERKQTPMEEAIQRQLDKLEQEGTLHYLKDLGIDFDGFVENFKDGIPSLDDKTKDYIRTLEDTGTLDSYLKGKFENIKVLLVSGADLGAARAALGFDNGHGVPSMMSVGNHIIINSDKVSDIGSMNNEKASLLGHEIIHSIQADAHGGIANFRAAYEQASKDAVAAGDHRYKDNKFEIVAYEFGGSQRKSQHFIGGWWR